MTLRTFRPALIFLSVVLALSCSKPPLRYDLTQSEFDWPLAGFNAARSFHTAADLTPPLHERKRFKLTSAVEQNIIVAGGLLFAPTKDGQLHVIDLATLTIKRRLKMPRKYATTVAAIPDGLVLAQRFGQETLIRHQLVTGKPVWKVEAGDIAGEPLVDGQVVYVAALYAHVDCYDLSDGHLIWQFRAEGQIHTSLALADGILVFATDRGHVYGLHTESGKEIWRVELGEAVLASPAIHAARVFVGTNDKRVVALDLYTGDFVWRQEIAGRVFNAPAVNDEMVVFPASDSRLHAFSPDKGELLWESEALSVIGTSPLLTGAHVFFGSLDQHLYCIDARDGELRWRQELPGRVRTNPIIWKDYLIVGSEDRYLHIFAQPDSSAAN